MKRERIENFEIIKRKNENEREKFNFNDYFKK